MSKQAATEKAKRRWPKRALIGVCALLAVAIVGMGVYFGNYYHAGQDAQDELTAWENGADAMASYEMRDLDLDDAALQAAAKLYATENLGATETDSAITVGDPNEAYGLVFYPGAKVEAKAYVPLACKLAQQGVYCVIAKMPLNFALFNVGAADQLMAAAPNVQHWWIAGHSLGGVAASMYAGENAGKLQGIALLASYSTTDLSASGLKALMVYGSRDGVLSLDKVAESAGNLPADATTVVVEGGNHAGIADYGAQEGDGEATISAEDQQSQTADAIVAAIRGNSASA